MCQKWTSSDIIILKLTKNDLFILHASSSKVQGQPLMVQVSGGQLITSSGQPIMVQAMTGGQGQTIMQVPVSGTQGLQQVGGAHFTCSCWL